MEKQCRVVSHSHYLHGTLPPKSQYSNDEMTNSRIYSCSSQQRDVMMAASIFNAQLDTSRLHWAIYNESVIFTSFLNIFIMLNLRNYFSNSVIEFVHILLLKFHFSYIFFGCKIVLIFILQFLAKIKKSLCRFFGHILQNSRSSSEIAFVLWERL